MDKVLKLENEKYFYFNNTKKDIIMTREEEEYRSNNIHQFSEKIIDSDEV